GLTSKRYAAARLRQFSSPLKVADTPVPPGNFTSKYKYPPEWGNKGTTHVSIADRWGNVLSMTTTIEENMGAGIVVPGRGFLLNNEMTDFTLEGFPDDTSSPAGTANCPDE
ncbi:gamma-glutamyltranspeptidase, partial [Baffinella frigidus]